MNVRLWSRDTLMAVMLLVPASQNDIEAWEKNFKGGTEENSPCVGRPEGLAFRSRSVAQGIYRGCLLIWLFSCGMMGFLGHVVHYNWVDSES